MHSYYIKSKKIFITLLLIIVLSVSFSQVFAAYDRNSLKLGVKLKFTGNSLVVYKSRLHALTKNKKDISYLNKNEEITVKSIFR